MNKNVDFSCYWKKIDAIRLMLKNRLILILCYWLLK